MTGIVLKESIRCQCNHCKEEAMAHEIVALRAERDALRKEIERKDAALAQYANSIN